MTFDPSTPLKWPRRWRRLFLATLPISLPLWAIGMSLLVIGLLIILVIALPIDWFVRKWHEPPLPFDGDFKHWEKVTPSHPKDQP